MKLIVTHILLFFFTIQILSAQQDDGVVALDLPIRNSLTYNRFIINPTFSFVREQNKYITIYNKRQWSPFDDAPQTILGNYAGRFKENIGAGISVFQQNFGILTTFGGLLNFSYNAVLDRDSNLTFGLNLGAYQSGINNGKIITNFPEDPSLNNIPSNFLLTINPGINYGTEFLDFGVSVNNVVLYNINTSQLIQENPKQGIQGHFMYTGYINANSFFDESRVTGLVRATIEEESTIVSAAAMLTVPKGIWVQLGYNTLYGASGGIGLNITKQIGIEYNYEKSIGNLIDFGSSHEITLAYKFKNNNYFDYSRDDDIGALFPEGKNSKPKIVANNTKAAEKARQEAEKIAKQKEEEEVITQLEEDERYKAQKEAEAARKAKADALAKEEEADKLKQEEEARKAQEAADKLKQEEEARKAQEEADKLKQEEEARKAQEEADRLKQEEEAAFLNPKDDTGKSITTIINQTDDFKSQQNELLTKLNESLNTKDRTLQDLKNQNNLSDQGVVSVPGSFEELRAKNNAIKEGNNDLKLRQAELDKIIADREAKIKELEELYKKRKKERKNDDSNDYYKKSIASLKKDQLSAERFRQNLLSRLNAIEIATEIEKKKRIKRATFNDDDARYEQDREQLRIIKQATPVSDEPILAEDFDAGETQSDGIAVVRNIPKVEEGYYIIIAVHSDVSKRDDFLRKAVASGVSNIDFFFDLNTSKYYIYYQKFSFIGDAKEAVKQKGTKPYNNNMGIIKVQN